MATTNIELDIENITGVSDANDQFIISAQKSIVSSIPKNLLSFAQKVSSASTDGTAITFSVNDSIIDVQRNGYSCREIPMSDAAWALDSSSLKYATARHPVWYHKQGAVHFAPVTDGSNAGYVYYIDYSKIDDDSDLRNAVVYHAASKEFSKLASSKILDWSDITVPIPLSNPSFGSDLNISSIPPTAPSLSSSSVSFSTTAPTYVAPILESRTAFKYYSSGLSESDPGTFSISSISPSAPAAPSFTTPDVDSINISNLGIPPTYTSPTVTGDGTELTNVDDLDTDNTIDVHADQIEFDQWWSTAAHLIEDEEDTELAAAQIQKISTYINAYTQAMQNKLNEFNKENAEYQGKLQEAIQQAQINAQEAQQETNLLLQKENQEYAASLQKYSAEVQTYQSDVSKEVQQYQQKMAQYQLELSTSVQAWQNEESQKMAIYQSKLQDSLNSFNKENSEYQAQLQISIQDAQLSSQDDAQKIQKYSTELQSYKDDIDKTVQNYANSLQKNMKEYESKLALYNSNVQKYASEVGEKAQKSTFATQNAAYYAKEAEKYYNWAKLEVNSYMQNNSKMIRQAMATKIAAGEGT